MSTPTLNISDEELAIAGAKGHLRLFGQYCTPAWDWSPEHWKLIAQKLMAVERGEIKRLMIFSPPRHGKSEIGTIHFPAWFMLRNPDKRVIVTSYAANLAFTFSKRIRALVAEFGHLFGVNLDPHSKAVDEWDIENHHGKLIAQGVGGAITGQGASLFVIDDPFKNAEEANSPTRRQTVWDWYTSTAYTRLEPDGAIVITLTRWHDDDLAGRLLREMQTEGGEQWEVLNLPAIVDEDAEKLQKDPLGRKLGDPLWPSRFNMEALLRIKRAVGSYVWSALYQQRPQDLAGGAFKAHWFKWYNKNEVSFDGEKWYFRDEPMTLYQGVDPAISEKTSADDFVIATMGITPTFKLIIFELHDAHLDFPEQVSTIIRKYQEWLPERVGIETNAYQRALKQQVVRDALIPVKQLDHRGDKYTRLLSMTPFFENGQVYLRAALGDEAGYIDQTRIPDIRMHIKMKKFYEQAVTYNASATHDDLLDALQNIFDTAKPKGAPNEYYV